MRTTNMPRRTSVHANPLRTVNFAASHQSTQDGAMGNAFFNFLAPENPGYPGIVCDGLGADGFMQQNVTAFAASPVAAPLGSPPLGPHVPGM